MRKRIRLGSAGGPAVRHFIGENSTPATQRAQLDHGPGQKVKPG